MKKVIFIILITIMLLTTANFILRYIHINKIKEQITNIESYISKIGLNMEIANTNFHGWKFWDLSAELNDVEIYVNSMQSVIYFKMPYIHIKSAIQNMDTLDIKIILPNIIKGRADLHEGLMQSLGFQNNKYQLFINANDTLSINILVKNFLKAQKDTIFTTKINNLTINSIYQSDINFKMLDIEMLDIMFNTNDTSQKLWDIRCNLDKINLYLDLKKFTKKQNTLFANQDMQITLDLIKNKLSSIQHEYVGNLNMKNKMFDINAEGNNILDKRDNGKEHHHSKLNFMIHNFENFIEYITDIMITFKGGNSAEKTQELYDAINHFKQILSKHVNHYENNIIKFTTEDTDNGLIFQGLLAEEVFKEVITKFKNAQ